MAEQIVKLGDYGLAKTSDCEYNQINGYRVLFNSHNHHIYFNYKLLSGVGADTNGAYVKRLYWNYARQFWAGRTLVKYYYTYVMVPFGNFVDTDQASKDASYQNATYPTSEYAYSGSVIKSYVSTTSTAYNSSLQKEGGNASCIVAMLLKRTQSWTGYFSSGYGEELLTETRSIISNINRTFTQEQFNNASCLHCGGENKVSFIATIGDTDKYRVKNWLANSSVVSGSEGKLEITPTFPSQDVVYKCVFEQYKWAFTLKSNVDISIGAVTNPETSAYKEKGETILLEAVCEDEANYRFVGWFKGYGDNVDADACIERISTDTVLSYLTEDKDITIVAKFAPRKTKLVVEVDGNGTYSLSINGVKKVTDTVSQFVDDDARDGWTVLVEAKPSDRYFFSHWLIPSGETLTTSIYEPITSLILPPREENKLIAHFIEKSIVVIRGSVEGEGTVTYSGDLSNGGSFDNTTPHVTTDTYIETPYAFVAKPKNKLYAFSKWQYLVGETWVDITTQETIPSSWIQSVNGDTAVVFVKNGDATSVRHLRAVFIKLNTYTIDSITIEGSHPILQGVEASSPDSGCTYQGLPEADEIGENGESRWIEGTVIEIVPVAGPKWIYSNAIVIMSVWNEAEKKYDEVISDSLNFTLKGNVFRIQIIFEARKYTIKTSVDETSSKVGIAYFTYQRIDGATEPVVEANDVYIDTDITIVAKRDESKYGENDVHFYDWKLNNIQMPFEAVHTIKSIASNMNFSAQFSVRQTFQYVGSKEINNTVYNFGNISIKYEKNGVEDYPLEMPEEGTSNDLMVRCGSSLSFTAKGRIVNDGVANFQGFFKGWSELNNGLWTPVNGWTESVETKVTEPKTIKGEFNDTEVWSILRLRNFAETLNYCNFIVSGVLDDREQKISEDKTVVLTNAFDFFCKPFSTIRIRLEKTDEMYRFVKWHRFTLNLTDASSEVEVDDDFSENQDLTFVITGDTSLRPEFYLGAPVVIRAAHVTGSETFGVVDVEGNPIELVGQEKDKAFAQGDTVTLVASPDNGYKFVGWFADVNATTDVLSTSSFYSVTVGSQAKYYYAKFEQDKNAIYTFGTSSEHKQAHWSSKRIMTNTPVSFSTTQVDAEGYESVVVDIFHGSSPQTPFKCESYTFKNANTKRLRMCRPEKLFEFSIKTTTPINFMAFSTSVGGLIGGA